MRLIYTPEAEQDLADATRFDSARSPGLGDRFVAEFDATVAEIRRFPELWPVIRGGVRSRTMRRFPFAI